MSALDYVPDEWGPKFDGESGAVTRTRTGPNEIALQAPAHIALVMLTPQPAREVALNSDRTKIALCPVGAVEIVPATAELFARWGAPKENVLIAFGNEQLTRLAGKEFQKDEVHFQPPQPGVVDQKALILSKLLREELLRGDTANRLCIDSLITLFGAHILRTYTSFSGSPNPPMSGGLSSAAWRRVTDYIHANLAKNLTVNRLAEVAGLSPSHFLRVFRQTSGQAPHSYVIAQRLALVERLAATTDLHLGAIAKTAGFSSHSHMTATMKRLTGTTPNDYRRERKQEYCESD